MCHPEVPPGQSTPEVAREEIGVPLANGETLPALLARPQGDVAPGVLLIADIFGRSPFYESLAARLATAGFEALLPDLFFRQGPLIERTREAAIGRARRLDQFRVREDVGEAVRWLRGRRGHGGRVGTLGFCMGGTLALCLAAGDDALATVCYYGFPAGPAFAPASARPPAPLDLTDDMRGPILGFWGDQDAGVGMDNVAELARRLEQRGVDYQQRIYPGLGHGFMAASRFDESSDAYEAACESWTMTLDLYRRHLHAPAGAGDPGRPTPAGGAGTP